MFVFAFVFACVFAASACLCWIFGWKVVLFQVSFVIIACLRVGLLVFASMCACLLVVCLCSASVFC